MLLPRAPLQNLKGLLRVSETVSQQSEVVHKYVAERSDQRRLGVLSVAAGNHSFRDVWVQLLG